MRSKPALQSFIENFVGGGFNTTTSTVTLGATATLLLPSNFERMAANIINTGSNNIIVAPTKLVASTMGILLGSLGGSLSLTANEDLALVGWDWWGISTSGAPVVTTIEITRIYDATMAKGDA